MVPILSYAQHYKKYYTVQFEGAAAAYGLNQLEIDILLFLHNNPELCTASDICRYRALAKSNVSAAVERLRRSIEPLFAGFTLEEQQALQDYLRRMDANILRCLQKE